MSLKFIPPWIPAPVSSIDVHEDDEAGVTIGLVHLTKDQSAAKAIAEANEDAVRKRRRANADACAAAKSDRAAVEAEEKLERLVEAHRQLEEDGTWDDCLIPTLEKARRAQARNNANAQKAKLVAPAVEQGFLSDYPSEEVQQYGNQRTLRKVVLENGRAGFSFHKYFSDEKGNRYTVYVQLAVEPSDPEIAEQLNRASWARMRSLKEKSFRYRDGTPMPQEDARQQRFGRKYQVGLFWREASRKDYIPWYGGLNAREVRACELPCVDLGVMENGKIGPVKRPEKPIALVVPETKPNESAPCDGLAWYFDQLSLGTGPPD
jgi:hypothetical protein